MPGWKYAFSLTREAVKAATPPGTVRLIEHSATRQNGRYVDRIAKHPIPTSDPADPLNWTRWRKSVSLAVLCLYAFVAHFVAASLTPALPTWNLFFPGNPRPFDKLLQFVSFNILLLGLGNIFWVPLSNVFGRRPAVVLSALMLCITSACGIVTDNFKKILIIRIFQGLGSSVAETVAVAMVGDMFFVHERGTMMALYTASLVGGSIVGGICGGYIAMRLGWFALFQIYTGLSGSTFLFAVLLVPETIYERDVLYLPIQQTLPRASRYFPRTPAPYLSLASLPSTIRITLPSRFCYAGSGEIDHQDPPLTWYQTASSSDVTSSAPSPARQSKHTKSSHAAALSNLRFSPYTYPRSLTFGMNRGNFRHRFSKPWATLRMPVTWIVMLQYGGLVGGAAVISSVGPQILSQAPYGWGENSDLLFVGALIGIVCGGIYTSGFADHRLKELAKNQDYGFSEPESRVPIMLPSLALATAGLLVFGFCAQYSGPHQWVGLEFAYGMVAFALTQVPSTWFCYVVDSYAQLASDCLVMVCILRGMVPFAWTFFVLKWVQRDGFLVSFGSLTVIMGVFSLLVVPLMWSGKRIRIATARYIVSNQ